MSKFILPIGFKHEGKTITELDIADTGAEAEKIYTDKPTPAKLHEWFGKVLAASIHNIGGEVVAKDYLAAPPKDRVVPAIIKKIPFLDVGSLLVQVQRECWEETIEEQKIQCTSCAEKLEADIELNKIDIPKSTGELLEFFDVKLPNTYTIDAGGVEQLVDYDGLKYNHIKFRTATLADGIKHGKVVKDEITFWKRLAMDTMVSLYFEDEDGSIEEIPDGYIAKKASSLFTKEFGSKTLKAIRKGVQTTQPSARYFYEEECPECGQMTPFFASVSNFFAS